MIVKGQKINDRYEIVHTIGEGGMANVYLAHDTILDRDVAVKILRGDLAGDEKFVRRFQREAISASSLSHPNIVEMYDVGEDDGKYFIVMEYVNGKTLKSLTKKRGSLTIPEVMDIMLQVTSGIAHAHDSYIIHRDIKPQNIMILDNGMIKITDFGIAMALNSHELTQTNSVMGSVHYLPPEQANGSGSTIKSDIYSLGILMFELLTGKVPFKGENAVEIAIKQMKEQIPSICQINNEIPQSIENIILRASAKNPKNRYDSINQMHEDILNCLNEEHKNDRRIVYQFPEQEELEETKVMQTLPWIFPKKASKKDTIVGEDVKNNNNPFIIMAIIFIVLGTLVALLTIILPTLMVVKEVAIPNVSNMTVSEAEDALDDVGLQIYITQKSDIDIEEGKVIGTNPVAGEVVKKGRSINLIVSSGANVLTLEDYTGKNQLEIKATLEAKGMYVLVEKRDVDNPEDYEENIIMSQSPSEGTKLVAGDTVTLYIPNIVSEYPNFVTDNWTIAEVESFADKYSLVLTIEYRTTNEYDNGSIISQSRAAGSPILANTNFKVIVAISEDNDVNPGM
jgi:beta-lactam-binding protein with PASTA domain/predicted Ser/Thr protein kinase